MDSGPETPAQYRYGAVEKKIGCCITPDSTQRIHRQIHLRGGSHGSWISEENARSPPRRHSTVYDNYNALAIGFSPSERSSEAIFSIVLYPRYVTLFFLQGKNVPDPNMLLQGSGKIVRTIRLESASDLDKPAVKQLIGAALKSAKVPIDHKVKNKLIIRAVLAKQRPRRPTK